MYTSITTKLDKIREQNKNPSVLDIIQAAQLEEEIYERSEMSKVTLNLNNIDIDAESIEADEEQLLAMELKRKHEEEPEDDDEQDNPQFEKYNPRWNQQQPDQSRGC